MQAGDPAGIPAAETAAPWLQPGLASGTGGDVIDPGAWGSVNSFAFTTALIERLPESDRAFAALRASAGQASAPEAIAMLADGHGYTLTRMCRATAGCARERWLKHASATPGLRPPCSAWASASNHAESEAQFRAALAWHDEVDLPLEHAETLLAYGSFLRRSGQPASARPVLARAVQIAGGAGAGWLAGLASAELKVAGGRLRRHAVSGALTAQEERVAGLAATGAANAAIARQLVLSVSTVETHLERIYAKLGIHSRYELIAKATGTGWDPKN